MAGIFCDSFDLYATADITASSRWNSSLTGGGSFSIGAFGRNSTNGLRVTSNGANSNGPFLYRSVVSSGVTVIIGFSFKPSALPGGSGPNRAVINILSGSSEQFCLSFLQTGKLSLLRGSVTGTTLATSTNSLTTGVEQYIELKVLIDASAGTYELRVNGTSTNWIPAATGQNTRGAATTAWDGISIGKQGTNVSGSNGQTDDYDDFYLCDGSGSANNDFLGDIRVKAQLPSIGNGAMADFTPSTGTDHGALVDESTPNTSDYNSSNTPGQRDTYVFPSLGLTGTVKFLQTSMYVAKADAGARTVAPVHRIGGVNYDGTTVNPGTAWRYLSQVYDNSPATVTAWTTTEINGAETGGKLVA